MSNDEDFCERDLEAPPQTPVSRIRKARSPRTLGWWIGAGVAIAALVWAAALVRSTRPSDEKLQAAHDQGVAEAQIDDAAYGKELAVARAVQVKAHHKAVIQPADPNADTNPAVMPAE